MIAQWGMPSKETQNVAQKALSYPWILLLLNAVFFVWFGLLLTRHLVHWFLLGEKPLKLENYQPNKFATIVNYLQPKKLFLISGFTPKFMRLSLTLNASDLLTWWIKGAWFFILVFVLVNPMHRFLSCFFDKFCPWSSELFRYMVSGSNKSTVIISDSRN